MNIKLTPKQEAFCQAFIQTGNKSAAYRMSYNCSKMKDETINNKAYVLSRRDDIRTRIEQLQSVVAERNKITIDEIVSSLADMVRFDIAELYDDKGCLKPIHQIPIHARQMISEIETFEEYLGTGGDKRAVGQVQKVKIVRKLDAAEKLMRHLGGYQKDNAQKTSVLVMSNDERKSRLQELRKKLDNG